MRAVLAVDMLHDFVDGAFIRGYAITVPRDAVCAFEGVDEEEALDYLHMVYGARIVTVDELVGERMEAGHRS